MVLAQVAIEIDAPVTTRAVTISVDAAVRTADGRETDPPAGERGVRVLSWQDRTTRRLGTSPTLRVYTPGRTTLLTVDVELPRSAAGVLSFSVDEAVE
jgi:hypothetical protein